MDFTPLRSRTVPGLTKKALVQWAQNALASSTLIVSDGLTCFSNAAENVGDREHVLVGNPRRSDLECLHWVNTLLGNIKRSIQGTYHGFKFDKYAALYLAEFQYRINRRFDMPGMVPRLLSASVLTEGRP